MKLLLHACCGPCSLEPVRLLEEAGHSLTLAYCNSNIHPAEEYQHRRDTLIAWAHDAGLPVIEGVYDAVAWEDTAGAIAALPDSTRADRCRACYRLRFEEAARFAAENDYEGICTTLTVSPYQFTSIIEEELTRAAEKHGVAVVFEDFRAFYPEATNRSRALGMYRQNYCGCRLSDLEAAAEREERKRARKAAKEAKKRAHENK